MTSSLDSKPFFAARAVAIGLDSHVLTCLKNAGVTTLAEMAFWCTYQLGASDDTVLIKAASDALGIDPVPAKTMIGIRRLHYEARTIFVSDLRQKVVSTEDDAPKRVPAAERAARFEEQKVRLVGLTLDGVHECSHALLDAVMQQYEHDELKWLNIGSCTSRHQELSGLKKDAHFSLNAEGQLRLSPSSVTAVADITTELKVLQAFTRRSLAYDQAGLISYSVHTNWINQIFKAMARSVPDNFNMVTVQQCLDADKELFAKMSDACRSGIVPLPGSPRPLDLALEKFRNHPDVLYFILPLPKGAKQSFGSADNQKAGGDDANKKRKFENFGGKASGKGGKGAKGKKGKGDARMPEGCVNRTKEGKNICFRFNCKVGCKYAKPGKTCIRGLHVCAKQGCQEPHSAEVCTKAA